MTAIASEAAMAATRRPEVTAPFGGTSAMNGMITHVS